MGAGGHFDDNHPARFENPVNLGQSCGIVFNMLQYVECDDRIEGIRRQRAFQQIEPQ